jgi:hypothetical protein
MDTTFAPEWQAMIKTVHEESLASPHSAPYVQTLRNVRAQQATTEELIALGFKFDELLPKRFQLIYGKELARITNETGTFASRLIPSFRALPNCIHHAMTSMNSRAF